MRYSRYASPQSLARALDGTHLGVNQLALDGELMVLRARAQQILDWLDDDGEDAWPSRCWPCSV